MAINSTIGKCHNCGDNTTEWVGNRKVCDSCRRLGHTNTSESYCKRCELDAGWAFVARIARAERDWR